MKSAGKARNNGLYRHIRTSKEIIRNLLNDYVEQFVHVGLPFVHRGIEKIKYSVILSTYHGKQIKLSVIVRQLRRGG